MKKSEEEMQKAKKSVVLNVNLDDSDLHYKIFFSIFDS